MLLEELEPDALVPATGVDGGDFPTAALVETVGTEHAMSVPVADRNVVLIDQLGHQEQA